MRAAPGVPFVRELQVECVTIKSLKIEGLLISAVRLQPHTAQADRLDRRFVQRLASALPTFQLIRPAAGRRLVPMPLVWDSPSWAIGSWYHQA